MLLVQKQEKLQEKLSITESKSERISIHAELKKTKNFDWTGGNQLKVDQVWWISQILSANHDLIQDKINYKGSYFVDL